MNCNFFITILLVSFCSLFCKGQYLPKNYSEDDILKAYEWVNNTYNKLSQDEKLGQLFIVALYTNKGEEHINTIRELVKTEKLGGLILMQDNAEKHIMLVNEFQKLSKVPMIIGMDAEWGVYQRISNAPKFPWAITLGALKDKTIISEMSAIIAEDAKKMGIHWNFAPVVDVNTNPSNPIIGNRSFGSEVDNVISSSLAYAKGLQDNNILSAIKHFPGHGDTNKDSHHDLPIISHSISRLNKVELAPFNYLMDKGIGGVMIAHLYVPTLEKKEGIPASISKSIITDLLKNKYSYKGLIITDALNMSAVADRYKPGELDALAFRAGNDIMLFSEGVREGKRLIQEGLNNGEIESNRLEESVKKILFTKYVLGLNEYKPSIATDIDLFLNSPKHQEINQKIYSNAITLLKDDKKLLPIKDELIYYVPLEEAPFDPFYKNLKDLNINMKLIKIDEVFKIPNHSKVLLGVHKDNSTAYKPFKISEESKKIINKISTNNNVILTIFGSPYALQDINITNISTVLVSYENNEHSMKASANSLAGKNKIHGRLPVTVNKNIKAGAGIDFNLYEE